MAQNGVRRKRSPSSFRVAAVSVVLTLIVAGSAAYFLGYLGPRGRGADKHQMVGAMQAPSGTNEAKVKEGVKKGDRKILYWRSSMNPMEIYNQPGKDQMGMELVPVYEDEVTGGVEVRIDPVTQQNMGVRTAPVEKGPLVYTIRTYGHLTYDETRTADLSPKFSGWIEKLYIDFTGQPVRRGQPMFDIYSPELVTAQEEYLQAYRSLKAVSDKGARDLLASARQRLLYWDVPQEEISAIERSGRVKKTLTIRSPFDGVVIHKSAFEGFSVKSGTTIYKIADLSKVWVDAHIFEYEMPWVHLGQEVEVTLPYRPGKVYAAKVAYVYPYLQKKTRDVLIRMELENPELELKPDMYADVVIKSASEGEGLMIPSEAVIRTGVRNVVIVAKGEGRFMPRVVTLGIPVEGKKVQILSGLSEGETVVTSGQFLIDSESTLREAIQKML